MARFPVYEQKTRLNLQRADAADFGSIEAKAKASFAAGMNDLGQSLMAIEQRKRTREETINRVRALNSFSTQAEQELVRIQTEGDLTSSETLKEYNSFLQNNINNFIGNYQGSIEGRDELLAQLEKHSGNYAQSAYKASISAQFKMIGNHMDGVINDISSQSGNSPVEFLNHLKRLDIEVDKMSPALTPEQEDSYRMMGREKIVKSTVISYLNTGQLDAAKSVLATPGISEAVSSDTMLQLRQNIIAKEREVEKGAIEGRQKLMEAATILGVPVSSLTPEMRLDIAGLGNSPQAKIAYYERKLGRSLTPNEVAKMGGFSEGGEFGSSLDGRSLDIMNDLSPTLAAGLITPADLRRLETAIVSYTQPKQYQDPNTGQLMTRRNQLPPHIVEAYNRVGRQLPISSESGQPGGTVSITLDSPPPSDPSKTIWGRRYNIAGAVPTTGQFLGRTPGLGGPIFAGGGDYAVDREYASRLQKDLVRVLQNNPKYAEGERQSIEKEVNIVSGVWDNPTAYEKRLIGLDEFLEQRMNTAFKTAASGNVSLDERKAAMNIANAVNQFRMHLGLPPKVKTPEEAKKLPPGSEFVDPDNNVRMVPRQ